MRHREPSGVHQLGWGVFGGSRAGLIPRYSALPSLAANALVVSNGPAVLNYGKANIRGLRLTN